jgi:hypothetical protein
MIAYVGALAGMLGGWKFSYVECCLEKSDKNDFRIAAILMLLCVTLIIWPDIGGLYDLAWCFAFMSVPTSIGFLAGKRYHKE